MDLLGLRDGQPVGRALGVSVTVRCLLLLTPAFVVLAALFDYGLTGFDTSGRGVLGACEYASECGHPLVLLSVVSGLFIVSGAAVAGGFGANHSGARRPHLAHAALTALGLALICAVWLMLAVPAAA